MSDAVDDGTCIYCAEESAFRGLIDGDLEPLVAYLDGMKDGEALDRDVRSVLISMMRSDGDERIEKADTFKLKTVPRDGRAGKPKKHSTMLQTGVKNRRAREAFLEADGFTRLNQQSAIHQAHKASGLSEETCRKRISKWKKEIEHDLSRKSCFDGLWTSIKD